MTFHNPGGWKGVMLVFGRGLVDAGGYGSRASKNASSCYCVGLKTDGQLKHLLS